MKKLGIVIKKIKFFISLTSFAYSGFPYQNKTFAIIIGLSKKNKNNKKTQKNLNLSIRIEEQIYLY